MCDWLQVCPGPMGANDTQMPTSMSQPTKERIADKIGLDSCSGSDARHRATSVSRVCLRHPLVMLQTAANKAKAIDWNMLAIRRHETIDQVPLFDALGVKLSLASSPHLDGHQRAVATQRERLPWIPLGCQDHHDTLNVTRHGHQVITPTPHEDRGRRATIVPLAGRLLNSITRREMRPRVHRLVS